MLKILMFLFKTLSYQTAFVKIRRRGVLFYLKTLQALRKSLILTLMIFLTLQMMLFGLIGAVASGIWLLPIEDHNTRLWILFGVSSFFFLIPLLFLTLLLSEKTWFKASGAQDLLKSSEAA